jgi:hypothetical protein
LHTAKKIKRKEKNPPKWSVTRSSMKPLLPITDHHAHICQAHNFNMNIVKQNRVCTTCCVASSSPHPLQTHHTPKDSRVHVWSLRGHHRLNEQPCMQSELYGYGRPSLPSPPLRGLKLDMSM